MFIDSKHLISCIFYYLFMASQTGNPMTITQLCSDDHVNAFNDRSSNDGYIKWMIGYSNGCYSKLEYMLVNDINIKFSLRMILEIVI